MMVSKAIEPQIRALPGLMTGCFTRASLVVGDAQRQACQLLGELDLAGQARILAAGAEVRQQILLVGVLRRQGASGMPRTQPALVFLTTEHRRCSRKTAVVNCGYFRDRGKELLTVLLIPFPAWQAVVNWADRTPASVGR